MISTMKDIDAYPGLVVDRHLVAAIEGGDKPILLNVAAGGNGEFKIAQWNGGD